MRWTIPTGILERTDDICRGKRRDAGIGSGEVIGDGKKRGVALLILFFALAMLVRAPGLGRWCLAVDEFYFSKAVSFILEKGLPMFPGGGYYTRGIGLQYLTTLPVSLIGNPELAVRIVPLLFGCMTIPLFFLFCRKFMGEGESILCTIILLLSSWHIELSRFARMYMPFQFFFFLFLYHVHSGFRENMPRHRLAAWIVATLTVFVYEGSVIPALLLAALVLTGDAGKTKKDLALFTALFLGLLALNLAANLPDYRSMGVSEAELVATAPPLPVPPAAPASTSSAPDDSPVLLPNPGLLAFAFRSWMGRVLLVLFACAGAWLTARSVRKYEGPFPKAVLLVSLFPLPRPAAGPPVRSIGGFWGPPGDEPEGYPPDGRKRSSLLGNLRPSDLDVLDPCSGAVRKPASNHVTFLSGYPPIKYSVVAPFMQAIPLWMVFLFGTAAFSILRNVLFRRWEEDSFPITILILCLALVPVFKTLYKETRYSFFFFPLFLVVAMGEMRAIRLLPVREGMARLRKESGIPPSHDSPRDLSVDGGFPRSPRIRCVRARSQLQDGTVTGSSPTTGIPGSTSRPRCVSWKESTWKGMLSCWNRSPCHSIWGNRSSITSRRTANGSGELHGKGARKSYGRAAP